ncbi:MAG: PatB family C-S lyase [Tannerellaceae bacterium]|jgi:cystathionine beta-lyase|nr:PatB family C-S lyase [Tannerellaceae bacterium]
MKMKLTKYNFDEQTDRRGTDSLKVDLMEERFGRAGLIPLWVADMEFRTPDFIVDSLRSRCDHSIFGYTFASSSYFESIIGWLSRRYSLKVRKEWLRYIPGIVKGIAFVVDCFTQAGDKVIIQPPVYTPFRSIPEMQGRIVIDNPLRMAKGQYEMDFEHLERIIDESCKLFILCSPHNPGGMVWSRETLARLAEICSRRNILIISDEIHAEMTWPGNLHLPFPGVSPEAAACSVTFMSPSKTFNIAGIVSSYAIVPNDAIRTRFFSWLQARELNQGNIFAYEATKAAYTHGEEWLKQMCDYVTGNVKYIDEYCRKEIPYVKVYFPQASFLVWLDCRELKLPQSELVSLFRDKAGLALNDGAMFGAGGEGFMRLNAGCRRSMIEQAMKQLRDAIQL